VQQFYDFLRLIIFFYITSLVAGGTLELFESSKLKVNHGFKIKMLQSKTALSRSGIFEITTSYP
jgi:hypothetical protein